MLTSRQRQYLKAQAHKLKPVMHVGKGGVTPAQAAELDVMVDSLELVKVKINPNSFEDEDTAARALCAAVPDLQHVWTIGHTMLFFRPSRTHEPRYSLPS
ncbi:YhbY family RNA-binding protein [Geothrix sp. PMB-07]|uniref:YhbY family RNA-binding protein n=1 Tax=Geothrix sp. PMB-07 TaxID=3068640 RepID=UPI0027405DD6|nr:YhbY family RNA-binding protein [Geothrix sp. PMB-07]WLT33223.1 YhbY family RNA-binding protein [Geothrix sp. PMB-07]